MFLEVRASRFKSWKSLNSAPWAPITGFFGANSSGKTGILQLLLLLKQTTESADRTQTLNLGDLRSHVRFGNFADVLYGRTTDEPLELALIWRPAEPLTVLDPVTEDAVLFTADSLEFFVRLTASAGGAPSVEQLEYRTTSAQVRFSRHQKSSAEYHLAATVNGKSDYLVRNKGRVWPLPRPLKCYGFPDQTYGYFQNAGFLADLELAFETQLNRTFYLGPLREYPQREYVWAGGVGSVGDRGAGCIDTILASADRKPQNFRRRNRKGHPTKYISLEQHVAEWLMELGLVAAFSVSPEAKGSDIYRVWVKRTEDSPPVLLPDIGFGVSQVLPVLVLLADVPPGSTVLLEQPEIHLHPSVQAGLADIIVEAALTRHVQVVLESHSEHLLRRLQRRVAEQRVQQSDIALYFCEQVQGASEIRSLGLNMFGQIENWPSDFFGDMLSETATIAEAALRRSGGSS